MPPAYWLVETKIVSHLFLRILLIKPFLKKLFFYNIFTCFLGVHQDLLLQKKGLIGQLRWEVAAYAVCPQPLLHPVILPALVSQFRAAAFLP